MSKIYGYCRKSSAKQHIERQVANITAVYPDAVIFQESFTGTTMNRPKWMQLKCKVVAGDTIVFDEVSRMARNAEEGFAEYKELYSKGINLVFLKESTLNTDNYRQTAQLAMTGTDVDVVLRGINEYLMILAEKQIKAAFQTAQHEVDYLHQRTREGMREAKKRGAQIGRIKGETYSTKKSKRAKEIIAKHSKSFGGSLSDADCMKLAGCSRNSLYKYKAELRAERENEVQ